MFFGSTAQRVSRLPFGRALVIGKRRFSISTSFNRISITRRNFSSAAAATSQVFNSDSPFSPHLHGNPNRSNSNTDNDNSQHQEFPDSMRRRLKRHSLWPPTSIQKRCLNPVLKARKTDVLVKAPPGSGKTAAFLVPILEKTKDLPAYEPVLWLTPTIELGEQTRFEANKLKYRHQKIVTLSDTLSENVQKLILREGHHIVISTPNTARKLIEKGILTARSQILVIDEADNLLSRGYIEDVMKVFSTLKDREKTLEQTLLFSATHPKWLQDTMQDKVRTPGNGLIIVKPRAEEGTFTSDISHHYLCCGGNFLGRIPNSEAKIGALVGYLLQDWLKGNSSSNQLSTDFEYPDAGSDIDSILNDGTTSEKQALIFCPTRADCDVLAAHPLVDLLNPVQLHNDMTDSDRRKIVRQFRERDFSILIATDVASRGLNLPSVNMVIHTPGTLSSRGQFGHSPVNSNFNSNVLGYVSPESYVHRTGRIRNGGSSIVLIASSQTDIAVRSKFAKKNLKGNNGLKKTKFDFVGSLQRQLSIKFNELEPPCENRLREYHIRKIAQGCERSLGLDSESFLKDIKEIIDNDSSSSDGTAALTSSTGSGSTNFNLSGPEFLARALSLLEQRTRAHEWISPLSGRARNVPILLQDTSLQKIKSRDQLLSILRKAFHGKISKKRFLRRKNVKNIVVNMGGNTDDANNFSSNSTKGLVDVIGRIVLTSAGYVLDVPQESVGPLLNCQQLRQIGITPRAVHQIPPLVRNEKLYRLQVWKSKVMAKKKEMENGGGDEEDSEGGAGSGEGEDIKMAQKRKVSALSGNGSGRKPSSAGYFRKLFIQPNQKKKRNITGNPDKAAGLK